MISLNPVGKGGYAMGVRNVEREELIRLEAKTLDARFMQIVRDGLGCSPFEADAVLEAVREVYFPFFDSAAPQAPPGKVTLVAVDADEPAGKSIGECVKRTVCLTVHRGEVDDKLLSRHGADAFRQARIVDVCQEALSQGALLTREDLAHRVFFVSTRTISRDLKVLREKEPDRPAALRGMIRDIGPVLTHRRRIVELALEGRTMVQICQITHHSPPAVANYLSTFVRCAQLAERGMQSGQIAFLLRRGKALVEEYLALAESSRGDANRQYHLDELLGLSRQGEKKDAGGAGHHGR
jgi:hypothetical protein